MIALEKLENSREDKAELKAELPDVRWADLAQTATGHGAHF